MLTVLNKHFQNILNVSKTQSGFIQTSVFGAYVLMALPSAFLIRRIGYQRGNAHWTIRGGHRRFHVRARRALVQNFRVFSLRSVRAFQRTGLHRNGRQSLASSCWVPSEGAAGRLSVAQAFNSVAYIIAPLIGGVLSFW